MPTDSPFAQFLGRVQNEIETAITGTPLRFNAEQAAAVSVGDRLRTVRQSLGLNQEAMSKHVGMGIAGWKSLESEGRAPKGEILSKLMEMGFSIDWLISGQGTMKRQAAVLDKEVALVETAAFLRGMDLPQLLAVHAFAVMLKSGGVLPEFFSLISDAFQSRGASQ